MRDNAEALRRLKNVEGHVRGDSPEERERVLKEIAEVFDTAKRT